MPCPFFIHYGVSPSKEEQPHNKQDQEAKEYWTSMSVGVWDKAEHLPLAEQTLIRMFQDQQWSLETAPCTHLPVFLSCLPMTWVEGYACHLHHMGLTQTRTVPAVQPFVSTAWQGTKALGVPYLARDGQLCFWSPCPKPGEIVLPDKVMFLGVPCEVVWRGGFEMSGSEQSLGDR